jgi:MFS family permease
MSNIEQIGRTFLSLKTRNYRLYFIGQGISLCGTWMQTIGQAWLVLKITGSGTALGMVAAFQFVPMLVLGSFGGVIADRFSKRKILYFTQTAAGGLALMLGILVATDLVKLWMIYIFVFSLGLVNAIDNPTRQTFIMEMVGKDQLPNAVSLNSTEVNLARVIGPAIGGGLIATLGLAPLFIINGISYVGVLVALFRMRAEELHPAVIAEHTKGQLREGFRYVKSTPLLLNSLLMMAIIGMLSYEFNVSLPLFARFTFQSDAAGYAGLTTAMGIGSVIGGLYTATRRKVTVWMLINAAWLFGLVILLTAIAPTLWLAMLGMVLVGIFSINFLSLANVTLQLESSAQMRGRVMGLWAVAFLGTTPIGGPIIGWIGQHAGPRWGLAVGGFAALAAGAVGARVLRKQQYQEIAT